MYDDTIVGSVLLAPLDSGLRAASQSAMLRLVAEEKLAGVTVFGDTISTQSAKKVAAEISAINPKLIIAVDHEGGSVQRYKGAGFTRLPSWRALCARPSEERTTLLARSAAELKAVGVSVVFAPVLDSEDGTGPLGDRSCSTDVQQIAEVATEYLRAFSAEGIMPVLKHYPGIGTVTTDLHKKLDALTALPPELPLFESLAAFRPAPGVMAAHVLVSQMSEDAPCSLSPVCLGTLHQKAPQAVVFSDALDMLAARYNVADPSEPLPLSEVAVKAIYAGEHMLVFGKGVTPAELKEVHDALKKEYNSSEIFREKIAEAVARTAVLRGQAQHVE